MGAAPATGPGSTSTLNGNSGTTVGSATLGGDPGASAAATTGCR
jgi:hypothetical protein